MKRYNVKIGNHVADGEGYATIAEAKREIKKLKHADDVYDICRSDGYYKIVEREISPWTVVPEIFPCKKCGKAPKHWFDSGELEFHVAHLCDATGDYYETQGHTAMSAAKEWNRQYGRKEEAK